MFTFTRQAPPYNNDVYVITVISSSYLKSVKMIKTICAVMRQSDYQT